MNHKREKTQTQITEILREQKRTNTTTRLRWETGIGNKSTRTNFLLKTKFN